MSIVNKRIFRTILKDPLLFRQNWWRNDLIQ